MGVEICCLNKRALHLDIFGRPVGSYQVLPQRTQSAESIYALIIECD